MTTFVQAPFWALGRGRGYSPLHAVPVVVTEPTVEPVSLAEVKNRLRVTSTADDADLIGLIIAARKQVEKDLGEACLVSTVVDHWTDRTPDDRVLTLTRWPLQSVATVKSYSLDDVEATLASTEYLVDAVSKPGRVVLNYDGSWPTGLRYHKALVVRHTSGFSGAAKAITSITRASATATVTTTAAHGYATGNRITIAGANQADYNGTFEIAVTGAATFTFTVANSPTTPATGTMTATDLGIPQLYTLAVMELVRHWWDRAEGEYPFSYWALLSDRVEAMA